MISRGRLAQSRECPFSNPIQGQISLAAEFFKGSDGISFGPRQLKPATMNSHYILPLQILNAYDLTNHAIHWTRVGLSNLPNWVKGTCSPNKLAL